MRNESEPFTKLDLLRALDIIHLDNEHLRLLSERRLDKKDMAWAVKHLSECFECCAVAPEITAQEIADALVGTEYERPDMTEQTINYYFETLREAKQ
jgi:hypothetical protein